MAKKKFVTEITVADPSATEEGQTIVLHARRERWGVESFVALAFAILPIIGFIIFSGFPLIISFIGMFCDLDLTKLSLGEEGWIVWNNFKSFALVFDTNSIMPSAGIGYAQFFYKSIGISVWIASTQLVTLAIALLIAALLHTKPVGTRFFQIMYFVPYICSSVAVALMWRWIFNDGDFGILNTILGLGQKVWLSDPGWVTWIIIIAIVWQAPGYGIVMYKAAFANVNQSYYEAADIDGANGLEKFWYITIPSISPTTFYLLMAGVTAGLLQYDLAANIAGQGWTIFDAGGKENMGLTFMRLVYYCVQTESTPQKVSYACIISWFVFLITGTTSMIIFKERNKRLNYA